MKRNDRKGFTIIEVVLVLAIAGLIFLMVFVAVPALQRGQKDTQRKNDVDRVAAAVTNSLSNGSNPLGPSFNNTSRSNCSPTQNSLGTNAACSFIRTYLNEGIAKNASESVAGAANTFKDPDGSYYRVYLFGSPGYNNGILKMSKSGSYDYTKFGTHYMVIVFNAKCSDTKPYVEDATGKNMFAVRYILEGEGVYCVDNQ